MDAKEKIFLENIVTQVLQRLLNEKELIKLRVIRREVQARTGEYLPTVIFLTIALVSLLHANDEAAITRVLIEAVESHGDKSGGDNNGK